MQDQPIKKSMPNPLMNYFRQPKMYLRLPSQGQFYPEGSLDKSEIDEYPVYAMTAKDELMFKTPDALMNGQATVEVIKSCIPAIKNPWNMPSVDLDACLIAIRIATYGETMDISANCPACKHDNEYTMNLVGYLDQINSFRYQDTVEVGPLVIKIRPYSYQEVSKVTLKTLEQQKIFSIVNDESLDSESKMQKFGESFVKLTELTVDIVVGCIVSITSPEGEVTDRDMIQEFIENAPSEVFNSLNNHIQHMKESMAIKAQHVNCQECNHEWDIEITLDQTNFFAVGS